jgi:IclR family acetate operon transcriptional repressor
MAHLAERSRVPGGRVASVARAVRVLEAFAGHPDGMALSELSAMLGCGKASLSKILGTLRREAFVRQDPRTQRFHLSWRLLALAFGHAHRVGIAAICFPILQALADETDELVQLAVLEQDQLLFVAKAEGPGQGIRMLPLVGLLAPVHATATGKAWLATLSDARVLAVLARHGMRRLTPHTITSRQKLMGELSEVRKRGYAIVDEELADGGRAVGAAITSAGRAVGAIAVSGPTFRLALGRLHEIAPRVRRAAAELGALWPLQVTARDFGLGARPKNGIGTRAARGAR